MTDKKGRGPLIESFRPLDKDPSLRAQRPTGKPAPTRGPIDIGPLIIKPKDPGKPRGGKKS